MCCGCINEQVIMIGALVSCLGMGSRVQHMHAGRKSPWVISFTLLFPSLSLSSLDLSPLDPFHCFPALSPCIPIYLGGPICARPSTPMPTSAASRFAPTSTSAASPYRTHHHHWLHQRMPPCPRNPTAVKHCEEMKPPLPADARETRDVITFRSVVTANSNLLFFILLLVCCVYRLGPVLDSIGLMANTVSTDGI